MKKIQGVNVSIKKIPKSVSSYQIQIDKGLKNLLLKCKSRLYGTKDEEHFGIKFTRFLIPKEFFSTYHTKEDQLLFDTELLLNGKKTIIATESQINCLNAYLQVNLQHIVDNLTLFSDKRN